MFWSARSLIEVSAVGDGQKPIEQWWHFLLVGVVLVAAKDQIQDVKKIVEALKAQNRSEVSQHRHV
jgi:hypothetical protein